MKNISNHQELIDSLQLSKLPYLLIWPHFELGYILWLVQKSSFNRHYWKLNVKILYPKPQSIHMMIFYSHLINGATMSISINEVLYRLTNEYHQTIEDRLFYIIVLIDSSNDNTCKHKSIIYLRIKIDSPIVLIMKRLLSIDGSK